MLSYLVFLLCALQLHTYVYELTLHTCIYIYIYIYLIKKNSIFLPVPLHLQAPESSVGQCLLLTSFSVLTSPSHPPHLTPPFLFKCQRLLHPLNS